MMAALRSLLVVAALGAAADEGTFWQVTDIHVDDAGACSGPTYKNGSHLFGNFDTPQYGCGCSLTTVEATARVHRLHRFER